jgi:hypothetical protein
MSAQVAIEQKSHLICCVVGTNQVRFVMAVKRQYSLAHVSLSAGTTGFAVQRACAVAMYNLLLWQAWTKVSYGVFGGGACERAEVMMANVCCVVHESTTGYWGLGPAMLLQLTCVLVC